MSQQKKQLTEKESLMLWGGILCWICCIATIFSAVRIDLLLTAWFIPGLIMEKEYRLYKEEQTVPDV